MVVIQLVELQINTFLSLSHYNVINSSYVELLNRLIIIYDGVPMHAHLKEKQILFIISFTVNSCACIHAI